MEYSFNLEWTDLDVDLREQKIDEVIAYDFENSNLLDRDGEPIYADIDLALFDKVLRSQVEDYISCHFPLYF